MNKKNTFFGALLVCGKNLPIEKHSTLGRHIRVLECTFLCIEFTLFNKKGCSSKKHPFSLLYTYPTGALCAANR